MRNMHKAVQQWRRGTIDIVRFVEGKDTVRFLLRQVLQRRRPARPNFWPGLGLLLVSFRVLKFRNVVERRTFSCAVGQFRWGLGRGRRRQRIHRLRRATRDQVQRRGRDSLRFASNSPSIENRKA